MKAFLPAALACFFPIAASAGCINLMADQNWALVEVRAGKFLNADANPIVRPAGRVSAGLVYTGGDGEMVCYRRENRPGDASSGLTVSPHCTSRSISGCEPFTIQ